MEKDLKRFYLAQWLVDTGTNRLSKGDVEIKLEAKMMAVLHYLAQHRNELVTREALEQAVWGNTVVGYDALTGCIAKLRKVLEDDPRKPRYIETISKKGYRLIADVNGDIPPAKSVPAPTADKRPPQRRWFGWLSGAAVLTVIAVALSWQSHESAESDIQDRALGRPALVVLPFANLGSDHTDDYFTDGMTADLTTALSKLSGLFVISLSSASGYKEASRDIGQIADTLGVGYVLEGSVRRTDEELRINVNLIDAQSNVYIWSEKYDRALADIFTVQDDVTADIVTALSIKLTEEEKQRTASRYTRSIEAYDDFLRGQALYIRHSRDENLQARRYFQQAIDRDQAFARAYSSMALTYVAEHRHRWSNASEDALDKALTLATQGISLNDELPQAYWVLGYVHLFRQDYGRAAEATQRAIALDPNFADAYLTLAVSTMHFGDSEKALQLVRKAMLINPKYPAAYASVLGQVHFSMQAFDRAIPVLRESIERNINLLTPHVYLVVSLSKLDRLEEATWAAEQLKTIRPDFKAADVVELLPVRDADLLADMQKHLKRAGV